MEMEPHKNYSASSSGTFLDAELSSSQGDALFTMLFSHIIHQDLARRVHEFDGVEVRVSTTDLNYMEEDIKIMRHSEFTLKT